MAVNAKDCEALANRLAEVEQERDRLAKALTNPSVSGMLGKKDEVWHWFCHRCKARWHGSHDDRYAPHRHNADCVLAFSP